MHREEIRLAIACANRILLLVDYGDGMGTEWVPIGPETAKRTMDRIGEDVFPGTTFVAGVLRLSY